MARTAGRMRHGPQGRNRNGGGTQCLCIGSGPGAGVSACHCEEAKPTWQSPGTRAVSGMRFGGLYREIATPLKGLAMTGVGMPRRQPSCAGILMQNARTSNAYPYDDTIPLVGAAIGRPPGRGLYNRGVLPRRRLMGGSPLTAFISISGGARRLRSVKLFCIDVLAYRAQT